MGAGGAYTHREEIALTKAYTHCSEDQIRGTEKKMKDIEVEIKEKFIDYLRLDSASFEFLAKAGKRSGRDLIRHFKGMVKNALQILSCRQIQFECKASGKSDAHVEEMAVKMYKEMYKHKNDFSYRHILTHLEKDVSWQKYAIPATTGSDLHCRFGQGRACQDCLNTKKEAWSKQGEEIQKREGRGQQT